MKTTANNHLLSSLLLAGLMVPGLRGQVVTYYNQIDPYISPGIRLGYVFSQGYTYSVEITIGLVGEYRKSVDYFSEWEIIYHSSIALGYQVVPDKPKRFTYMAGQGGISLFGLSLGRTFYEHGGELEKGIRFAVYGGYPFLLGSYEMYNFPQLSTKYSSVGLWGKLPLANFAPSGLVATCFAEGTKITMADGSLKSIDDIQIGDRVLSYNLKTGVTEPDEVLELYSTINNNMMGMEFSDGTVVHSTFDHPYYVKNKGWCSLKPETTNDLITNISDVGQLEEGDTCHLLKDGQLTEVVFVGSQRIPTFQRTYTIKKLKKNNTFFAEGVLVGVETVKEKEIKGLLGYLK